MSNDYGGYYITWYCDNCRTIMNGQPGFSTESGEWTCTECGFVNDVTENNVTEIEEEIPTRYAMCPTCGHRLRRVRDMFGDWDGETYSCDWCAAASKDEEEYISVYDAAEIWASNGKDEDYTFGYTEEELEDAFMGR
jgi:predicted RNA-binding Zn-ribbon protein involved in translation (DUF1610 family)